MRRSETNPADPPELEEEQFGDWTLTLRRGLLDLRAGKWQYQIELVNRRTGEKVEGLETGYANAYAAARQIILARNPAKERLLAW